MISDFACNAKRSEENLIISFIMSILFFQRSDIHFSNEEISAFELMYSEALQNNGIINYQSGFAKYRFADYIIQTKNLVVHGSNNTNIEKFETRRQTIYNGKIEDAIFAAKDGIWPIFYAVFDRSKLENNFRNGCFKAGNNLRYYFFSLTKQTLDRDPWTTGMVYFLPSGYFERTSKSSVYFDEWISKQEVRPLVKLFVNKDDFEYIDKISIHKPKESIIMTWLLYKIRSYRNPNRSDK